MMQDTGYRKKRISSFGKAFLSKKRFLVKIMGLCPMSPQALKGLMCNLVVCTNFLYMEMKE